jgi:hypothetical protein
MLRYADGAHRNASRQTRKLLSTLAAQPRTWRHDYELSKETGVTSGTLYPALMRLCLNGANPRERVVPRAIYID